MTDIPEDIMREAEEVSWTVCDAAIDLYENGTSATDPVLVIARALLAAEKRGAERMRQRCSGIASEHFFDEHEIAQATEYGRAVDETARLIDAAIRKEG